MFVRSVLSSYYRLLTGASLAFAVFALTGCNEKAAETADPGRPVLVATVHYEAETPERSFVGTIKPRIEADMASGSPARWPSGWSRSDRQSTSTTPLPPSTRST